MDEKEKTIIAQAIKITELEGELAWSKMSRDDNREWYEKESKKNTALEAEIIKLKIQIASKDEWILNRINGLIIKPKGAEVSE